MDSICDIECIRDIPLTHDGTIVTCSLFKTGNMYRDISIYFDGLNRLTDYIVSTNNMYLRLYIDSAVENDKKFSEFDEKYLDTKRVQIFKYKCPDFIDPSNELHIGLFGVFIRFLVLTEKKLHNNLRFISDTDFTDREIKYFLHYCWNKIKSSKNNCTIYTRIGYSRKYAGFFKFDLIDETSFCDIWLKNYTVPENLIYETIMEIKNTDVGNVMIEQMMEKGNLKVSSHLDKYKGVSKFIYGSDEYLVNKYILPNIAEHTDKINIFYSSDKLTVYITAIDWEKTEISEVILRNVLGKYYKDDLNSNISLLVKFLSYKSARTIPDYFRLHKTLEKYYSQLLMYHNNIKFKTDKNVLLRNLHLNCQKYLPNHFTLISNVTSDELYDFFSKNHQFKEVSTKKRYSDIILTTEGN